MDVVVNHLRFASSPSPEAARALEHEVAGRAREVEGFVAAHLVQVADDHCIMIVFGRNPEALQRISAEVGGPWVAEHLAPYFAKPPERWVGKLIGSTEFPAVDPL